MINVVNDSPMGENPECCQAISQETRLDLSQVKDQNRIIGSQEQGESVQSGSQIQYRSVDLGLEF